MIAGYGLDHCLSKSFSIAIATVVLSCAAYAQSPDWDRCVGKDNPAFDQRVVACTAIIDAPDLAPPDRARAFADRGVAYHNLGETTRAIQDYDESLRLDSESGASHRVRGNKYSAERNYDGAIVEFTEAIRLDPTDARAYGNRGIAHAAKNDHVRAIADYNEAIRMDPQLANVFISRGNAHLTQRNFSEAITDYTEAFRLGRSGHTNYYMRARAYHSSYNYERAIEDYSEAIRLNPKYAEAFLSRGLAHRAKGNSSEAIADFGSTLAINPKNVAALRNRGSTYLAQREYDRALVDYSEAIRLDPNSIDTLLGRAEVHSQKRSYDLAIADYDRVLSSDSTRASVYGARCGAKIAARHDTQVAISDCNEALRLQPDQFLAHLHRGYLHLKLGLTPQALDDFDAALARSSKDPWALYGRGLAKWKKKDLAGAETDAADANKIRPGIMGSVARYYGVTTPPDLASPLVEAGIRALPMIFAVAQGEAGTCGAGCSEWIVADGAFDVNAADRFRKFLAKLKGRKLPIVFNSTGGKSNEAFAIGRVLRERKMTASVGVTIPNGCSDRNQQPSCREIMQSGQPLQATLRPEGARCHSACVFAIMGGTTRTIPPGVTIGVHSSLLKSSQIKHAERGLALRRQYTAQMGADPTLVEIIRKTPFTDMYILSREEIARFKIETARYQP